MTEWYRVEPHTRSEDLEEGLQTRVADPLWLLARQWQVGEFRGEDAATPIHASLQVGWCPLRTFRNEAARAPRSEPLAGGTPLETRVEAMAAEEGPGALALAAEAGLQFLRRLDARNLGGLRGFYRSSFPLAVESARLSGLPAREQSRLRLLSRRAIDGRKLVAASDPEITAGARSAADRKTIQEIVATWREEYAQRFARPGASGDTWVDERLEHRFSVGAATPGGEVVLSASEYPGGRLDWCSFDVNATPRQGHGLASADLQTQSLQMLPVPLAYAGMPVSRCWEREESSVYFGGIEAGPADVGRLTVVEYATVFSPDWYLLPVRLPVGTLARVQRLHVFDAFGDEHQILPTAFLDAEGARAGAAVAERPWAYFELCGDPSPTVPVRRSPSGAVSPADEGKLAPWLFLPPALEGSLSGKPLEHVGFVRDEGANLAWAVESSIEAPTGHPLRRRHLWGLARQAQAEVARADAPLALPARAGGGEAWRYRLQTHVPPYWIPLIPEPVRPGASEMRLRRARMMAWDELPQTWAKGPQGQLLAPHRPLRLFEEEIPRGGVQVTRQWQLARGSDGKVHLWMARQKRPGRGERGSGLQYDTIKRS